MKKIVLIFLVLSLSVLNNAFAIDKKKDKKDKKKENEYSFTIIKEVKSTSVKSQDRSGTCWSYATTSFLESEILRIKEVETDLSEMFFVRYVYPAKALNFIRRQGKTNFGEGGQAHDVMNVVENKGIMPESAYLGNRTTPNYHDHSEMVAVLKGLLDAVLAQGKFTNRWEEAYISNLDIYMGKPDSIFEYNSKKVTSLEFADQMGIKADNYIEFTSYSHHPYYKAFNLEIPDNWSFDLFYNLPIDDFMKLIDNAISNNYSVVWDGDVSNKAFSHSKGVAIVPLKEWKDKSSKERKNTCKIVEEEKNILQNDRQISFNKQTTTDDHLMHLIGTAKDQTGKKYYIIKNSWGDDSNDYGGKFYMSESYVRLNTVAIMVNKEAIPSDVKLNLGL